MKFRKLGISLIWAHFNRPGKREPKIPPVEKTTHFF